MSAVTLRITRNFSRNLNEIEAFLRKVDAPEAFSGLLDDLFDEVLPALEVFPNMGADFFRHPTTCRETRVRANNLRQRLGPGTLLLELIRGDYLLLYACRKGELFLLAIRHHRQVSFDFSDHWPD